MAVMKLLEREPQWIALASERPEPVVLLQMSLARNLADFVFPDACADEERRAVENRLVSVLRRHAEFADGAYYSLAELDSHESRLLAERRLITYEMLSSTGARGVYVGADQSLGAMVNAGDHLVLRALHAGMRFESVWDRLNRVDDALGAALNFAYNDRRGFLTSSLGMAGTALKTSVLMHLPALAMLGRLSEAERIAASHRFVLRGLAIGDPRKGRHSVTSAIASWHGFSVEIEPAEQQCLYMDLLGVLSVAPSRAVGNLFTLVNRDTLGLSETEMALHAEQCASDIAGEEIRARDYLLSGKRDALEDSIGRMLGIAQKARLLGLQEGMTIWSLARMAHAMRLLRGQNLAALDALSLDAQSAHLQLARGTSWDAHLLCRERASMFRSAFEETSLN